jgi:hypothetical protein
MPIEICLLESALSELFAQATESGQLTLADRYGLMAALLKQGSLTDEERYVIDRMLYAAQRGRLRVVNDLSMVSSLGSSSVHCSLPLMGSSC